MEHLKIKPKYTLKQLYGEQAVFSSRPSFRENPWMPADMDQSNFLTAREITIAHLPTLVHAATQTDKIQRLFDLAGIEFTQQTYVFANEAEYAEQLKRWEQEQKTVVFQYMHEADEVDQALYWMDADVFNYLNSKAYINEIVPAEFVPKRLVVKGCDLAKQLTSWSLPVVLKPGDDSPTAGGYGVVICYDEQQLADGIQRFEDENTEVVIIEEWLDAEANYCCQYAYSEQLGIQYLGTSIQLTDEYGHYDGNVTVDYVPTEVIEAGKRIMEYGVDKGFSGVAGFDLILTKQGDIRAIDLNFRQNGSTAMLLFYEILDKPVNKFLSYFSAGDNELFFKTIESFVERNVLLPLSYYDGDYFNDPVISRFSGIWYADSLAEIEAFEQELKASGAITH